MGGPAISTGQCKEGKTTLFLERQPKWHGKVLLIQNTSPTGIKEHDAEQEESEKKIAELVTRINGTFGSLNFPPMLHYSQFLPEDEYFTLLRVAIVRTT